MTILESVLIRPRLRPLAAKFIRELIAIVEWQCGIDACKEFSKVRDVIKKSVESN
jgi:hypothetical protein